MLFDIYLAVMIHTELTMLCSNMLCNTVSSYIRIIANMTLIDTPKRKQNRIKLPCIVWAI